MTHDLIPAAVLKGVVSASVFILSDAFLDVHSLEQEIVLAAAAFGGLAALWRLFTRILERIVTDATRRGIEHSPVIGELRQDVDAVTQRVGEAESFMAGSAADRAAIHQQISDIARRER